MRANSKLSKSDGHKKIETERARQAFYIKFIAEYTEGLDPCTVDSDTIRDCHKVFVESLISGENIRNKDNMRAATILGYMKEINRLYALRNLPEPINFNDKNDPCYRLYIDLKQEEDIAARRKPLTNQMAAKIIKNGNESDFMSKQALARDVVVLSREMGCRASEILQTTKGKVDQHEYPSGKKVNKAMGRSWFKCYDKQGRLIKNPVKNRKNVSRIVITWLIQKNRRNGEECWYEKNEECKDLCVINAILNMFERAERLKQAEDAPMAVYADKNGKCRYLTRSELTDYMRKVAKEVHPHMTKAELALISCHSMRVWAAVLLSEKGKNGDYIKIRLRWVSEAYRIYLRNTAKSTTLHNEALKSNGAEINFELENLPDEVNYVTDEELDMGVYTDYAD